MKTKNLSKILFTVFLLAQFALSALSAQEFRRVARVVDGDTFVLEGGGRVRLIGVDTPETVHPSKPVEYFGKEAGNFTKSMIEGKRVRLVFDVRERDRYNRLLAYVYLEDGTFLNAELVKQGYAHAAAFPPNVRHVELFRSLEREARENSRGLWGGRVEVNTDFYTKRRDE